MSDLINSILKWLESVLQWFFDLVVDVLDAIWLMLQDLFSWASEEILDLIFELIDQLDFSDLEKYSSAWGDLPSEMLNVLGLLGIGDACVVIIAAIGIRLILQLIPFVRLGS
ncbi:Protein of unknown function [Lampropedia hyalina DSM 16112]|jgi:hypothetical protein|uniref:DUF2523 domain-containing protein n=1 Tax=Lampropedia hyalina DSM 16112 TaxID=1122156 RepID=A0A1M5ABT9_9BURK|nr:DUF2523 family protein [Lampropedia hyalina]SHF27719.1 Protein of unknown function [Lampropedia hyalina DSM 16112]